MNLLLSTYNLLTTYLLFSYATIIMVILNQVHRIFTLAVNYINGLVPVHSVRNPRDRAIFNTFHSCHFIQMTSVGYNQVRLALF